MNARRPAAPVARIVSPRFMIASPSLLRLSPVAMSVSPTLSASCNEREPDPPMSASPCADDCKPLQLSPGAGERRRARAVRAALAIQGALADLNARNAATGAPELAARIGLESGRVVVDSTGEVYGEAPNVAARVQSAAAPGEIWITLGVHRQIAGLFVAEDKGEHELKGLTEKAQLYRIVRASGGGRRGGSRAPTPLVGRAEELD